MIGKICGTGSYVPEYSLDNHDLAGMVETSDKWIQERTGVIRRHIAKEETTVSMAVEAARAALDNAGIEAEEIDMILVCTLSSNVIMPSAACEVQREIGAVHAFGFDLNAACTGFVYAYNTAQAYIQSGMCRTVLIIGSETLSNLTDWTDRSTCILFGDGAGAAILRAEEGRPLGSVSHSDGQKGAALTCESRHNRNWKPGAEDDRTYMQMDGQEVFKFAVRKVPEAIREILTKEELKTDKIDWFLLHQANKRIIEAVAKRLETDVNKFPMNLQEYGNTSSASIPILLDEWNRKGKLKKGQNIVLAGFGGGLSWGASLLTW